MGSHTDIARRTPGRWEAVGSYGGGFGVGTEEFRYRKIGDVVTVQGQFARPGGSAGAGSYTVATLPAGFRPPSGAEVRFICWHNNTGTAARIGVDSSGVITLVDAIPTGDTWEVFMQFSVSA